MKEHQIIFTKKLISNALVASSILATGAASAAGFALREQSAYGQGSSFAGVAAGGSISTAFWNPANTAEVKGTQIEGMASIISAKSVVNDTGISNIIYRNLEDTGDIGGTTLLPALYYAKEHDEKVSWGVSLTVPYGSSTEAGRGSKSQYVSVKAEAKSLSINPTASYKISENTSVGVGLIFQKLDIELERAIPVGAQFGVFSPNDPTFKIEGGGTGIGMSLGVTHKSGDTSFGFGYRSSMEHELDGSFSVAALGVDAPVTVDLTTPASFTLGIKHQATEKLNIGITAENVKWSSVGTLPVISQQSGSIVRLGSTPIAIPLNYEDSMYYSIGGEYQKSKDMVVRAGIGLDETVTRDNTRTTQLPDNDRYWLSLGFSKNLKSGMRFDLGYTYVFLKDKADINIGPGHSSFSGLPYTGEADPTVHILSAGFTKSL